MSLNTFLMLSNVLIFCSLIYRQVKVRRREAEIEEGQWWLRHMDKERHQWN